MACLWDCNGTACLFTRCAENDSCTLCTPATDLLEQKKREALACQQGSQLVAEPQHALPDVIHFRQSNACLGYVFVYPLLFNTELMRLCDIHRQTVVDIGEPQSPSTCNYKCCLLNCMCKVHKLLCSNYPTIALQSTSGKLMPA